LNTQRLALTSICGSAKVPSAVCSASANQQQPAASAKLITDTVGSVLSVTASLLVLRPYKTLHLPPKPLLLL